MAQGVGKLEDVDRLEMFYQRTGPYLYGAVHAVEGSLDNQRTSHPFVIAKMVGNTEIIYGCIPYFVDKVVELINEPSALTLPMPIETEAHVRDIIRGNLSLVPDSPEMDRFLHQHEIETERKILLISLHMRSLLEVVPGVKTNMNLYDYNQKIIGEISMKDALNAFMHYKYFVVNGQWICDLFTTREQPASPKWAVGSKIDVFDYFDAILKTVNGITVNDFIGAVRSKLAKLSVKSTMIDIMSTVQNVHSLSRVVNERIQDPRFNGMMNILFGDLMQRDIARMDTKSLPSTFRYSMTFRNLHFQIGGILSQKRLKLSTEFNGEPISVEIPYTELFSTLSQAFGDDPLIRIAPTPSPLENEL